MVGFPEGKFVQAMKIAVGPLEIDEVAVRKQLEAAAESTPNSPCARGYRTNFPVASAVKDDDPVRLPEIVAPDNYGFAGS